MTEREVKKSLWFLIVAAFSSAGLFCFFILDRDSGFAGLALGLVVLIGVPSTLLFGIDASRAIGRQKRTNHLMNNVGRVLGIPQSVFGVILMAFGVAYPVYHFMNGLGPSPLIWSRIHCSRAGDVQCRLSLLQRGLVPVGCVA
jgi:hypothetical protein